jgi:hypothetical protein
VARQVRCDHPMCCHQVWDHSPPKSCELSWAMQQNDRRSLPALQYGGGDAGQLQPAICDWQFRQQLFTRVVARGTALTVSAEMNR